MRCVSKSLPAPENLDAMVPDLAFVATRLTLDLTVAAGGVGVIGVSNDAIAGMGLQLQRHDVSAVISLDGAIGEDAGGTFLKERASGDVSRLAAPILHLYAPDNAHLNLAHLRSYTNAARTLVFVRGCAIRISWRIPCSIVSSIDFREPLQQTESVYAAF
jgi:hypothetical protein